MKLEQIIKLKFGEINKPKKEEDMIEPNPCGEPGYVAYGTKILDGKEVPNCIPDPEQMKKIIKEGFPIPSPSGEDEQTYISRCISEIGDEYPAEGQAYAVCKAKWDEK